jgi:hypothetical protein
MRMQEKLNGIIKMSKNDREKNLQIIEKHAKNEIKQ